MLNEIHQWKLYSYITFSDTPKTDIKAFQKKKKNDMKEYLTYIGFSLALLYSFIK